MIDKHGRRIDYLRLSVTQKCNFRCQYCVPDGCTKNPPTDMLTVDELVNVVKAGASLGITKLRITGGEPLMHPDILTICRRCAAVPGIQKLCITTNGAMLTESAEALKSAGVGFVNISLDTMDQQKYAAITRGGDLDQTILGLEKALTSGFHKVKLNAVLIAGFNDTEIGTLAQLTLRYPLDVRFIELMPLRSGAYFFEGKFLPCSDVLNTLEDAVRIGTDGTAELYRLPGALGNIGLISPVSRHFCRTCSRIRVTADGMIRPCLHSPAEYDLKGQDVPHMRQTMEAAIFNKPLWHGGLWDNASTANGRNMCQIGG